MMTTLSPTGGELMPSRVITESDYDLLLRNMGQTRSSTGKAPSNARKTHARCHDLAESVLPVGQTTGLPIKMGLQRTYQQGNSTGMPRQRTESHLSTSKAGVAPTAERLFRKQRVAGSSPAASSKREYDSKWEETYASELVLRKHAGLIVNYWYHPFSMWLPGKVRYTPDFMIEYPVGLERRMEIIDVKGWHKNIRAAMVAIRVASGIFPCYTWKLVKKQKGGGWEEEEI